MLPHRCLGVFRVPDLHAVLQTEVGFRAWGGGVSGPRADGPKGSKNTSEICQIGKKGGEFVWICIIIQHQHVDWTVFSNQQFWISIMWQIKHETWTSPIKACGFTYWICKRMGITHSTCGLHGISHQHFGYRSARPWKTMKNDLDSEGLPLYICIYIYIIHMLI